MQDITAQAEEALSRNTPDVDAASDASTSVMPAGVKSVMRATVVAPQLTLPTGAAGDSAHAAGLFPMSFGAGLVWYTARTDGGAQQYFALTTRGPTLPGPTVLDADGNPIRSRYCLTPVFQPRIMRLEVSESASRTLAPVMLANDEGKPLYGLPPRGSVTETALSLANDRLSGSDRSIAPEGLARASDDTFWITDGFTSSLRQFSAMGVERSTLSPGEGLPACLEARLGVLRGLTVLTDGRLLTIDRTGFGLPDTIGVVVADPTTKTSAAYLLKTTTPGEQPQDVAALADGTVLMLVRVPQVEAEVAETSEASEVSIVSRHMGLRLLRLDFSSAEDISSLTREALQAPERVPGETLRATVVLSEEDFAQLGVTADDAAVMRGMTLMPDGATVAMITENRFGARIHVEHRTDGVAEGAETGSEAIRHYVLDREGDVTLNGVKSEDRFIVTRLDPAKALTQLLQIAFEKPFVMPEASAVAVAATASEATAEAPESSLGDALHKSAEAATLPTQFAEAQTTGG